MKDMDELFRENLKRLRKERGFTQESLAEAISNSESGYQKYEQGAREPDLKTIGRMADAIGVEPSELFFRPGKPRAPTFADAIVLLSAYQAAGQPLQGVLMALATGDVNRLPDGLPPAVQPALKALLESLKATR